ncbi:MAG: hypothetical protein LBK25_05800 [Treponema sp.]|nr:hypothetical protein [Treponema sp.]
MPTHAKLTLVRRRLRFFLWFFLLCGFLHGEPQKGNTIFLDLNPSLLALFYLPLDIEGFGIEFGYLRDLPRGFALMGDIAFLSLSQWGADFSVWDLSLCGRYTMVEKGAVAFFSALKMGALLYTSPYYEGGTFTVGIELGLRRRIGARFMIEPYILCAVFADDRYLMPFTMETLTELLLPGFKAGVRFGVVF